MPKAFQKSWVIKKYGGLVNNYRPILQNFSYLTILQAFNIFFPIIIYPFLINIFGLELWGKIILAQSLALYVSLFIDFGFDRHATKEVSIHRNNRAKLSEVVSCVVVLRILLGLTTFALYSLVVFNFSFFEGSELLFLLFYAINFNFILFPKWFFQGIEQMKYIVIINVAVKVLFVLLMFLTIKDATDYLYVPIFFGLGAFFGGVIGLVLMLQNKNVKFGVYKLTNYYRQLEESFLLFASSLVISVKDRFNVFIVGYFLGMEEVAIYDVSIKMVSVVTQPVEAINGAIFPRVSINLNMAFVKKVALYTLMLVSFLVLVIQMFLTDIFGFLGINEIYFETSIRVLICGAIFLTLSVFLARNCYIVHNRFKLLFKSMVWSSAFYAGLVGVLFALGKITFTYLALVVFLVYLFEFIYRYFLAKKNDLLR